MLSGQGEAIHALRSPFPAPLFLNAHARRGRTTEATIRRALEKAGVPLSELVTLEDPAELPRRVEEAVRGGARAVLVGGGDGTVAAAASALVGKECALGVLPFGTGNDFARSLGLPLDWKKAAAVLAKGREKLVDVGRMDGRVFLNAASLGMTVRVTKQLSVRLKRAAGPLAYPLAAAKAASGMAPFRLELSSEGLSLSLEALQVVVGNGRFHGAGRLVAKDASVRDGMLDVWVASPSLREEAAASSKLRSLLVLVKAGRGTRGGGHTDAPEVLHLRCRKVRLSASPEQRVNLDGELAGKTPCELAVEPSRLRVLA